MGRSARRQPAYSADPLGQIFGVMRGFDNFALSYRVTLRYMPTVGHCLGAPCRRFDPGNPGQKRRPRICLSWLGWLRRALDRHLTVGRNAHQRLRLSRISTEQTRLWVRWWRA
jgi:hypothetical protein